jgi:SAM-dependent methyltransferase
MKNNSIVCTISCNLCGGRDVAVLGTKGREGEPLRTVICVNCGLAWSDPRPIEARKYYEEDYRKDYKKIETPRLIHIYRAGKGALDRWARIKIFVSKEARTLDVGSGGGEFLYLLTKLGLKAIGIEPNRGYANFSRDEYGVDVRAGMLNDMEFAEGEFHVVTMWHALEHVENPTAIFGQVREWMKEGGVFVVEVPNVEAVCQAPGHRFHRAHLYSFNPASLKGLGAKSGFAVEEVTLSEDGGNITAIFRKTQSALKKPAPLPGPENARQIQETLRRHTPFRHYLSHYPYTRPLQRLRNALHERIALGRFAQGENILKQTFE